ncbi:MAG TPA: cytochrome P450 [Acidimicrobiia bacterium]|nr:cytochrome P450 [Acidimicrobiia bacterium]
MTGILERAEPYYDPYDYEVDANAHAVWKRLRDEAPLYYNEKYDFFALSRFDDVLPAMLDTATFSSAHMTVLEMMTPEPSSGGMMIFMDPPEHTHLRKLVSRAFTPRAIHGLEARVRRLCARYLDQFVGNDGFDFVDQFGALVPPSVILALLGFPDDAADEWRHGVDEMFHMDETQQGFVDGRSAEEILEERQMTGDALFVMLPGILEERRREPRDDLISVLVQSDLEDDDGTTRKLTNAEIGSFVTLLSIAGTETVARLLSWAAVLLARHPDQRRVLVDDPALIPNAIEEMLRYEAPSPVNARWVNRDLEYHGRPVPKDSRMILLNGSADRDERHFADADVFDVRRTIDRHVAFGYGTHFCVGAALARLESRVAIEETLARFPAWDIDDAELEWVHTSTVRGYAKVPIHIR